MVNFEKVYFSPSDILIPKGVDMSKWSVVACDQYTSQSDYWDKVESIVGESPSSLRITLPEIYLSEPNINERINNINKTMQNYLEGKTFSCYGNSFIYVEREMPGGKIRKGLVGAVDLEAYDYRPENKSHIRATEKTVLERIPPRVEIRENAPLELPHIMLLTDDKEKTIIEQLAHKKNNFKIVYNFELMQNGGHIIGYHIPYEDAGELLNSLLAQKSKSDFLYAVGDGNHSLAAAKECWEQIKQTLPQEQRRRHKARYALAELVNIYDDSLIFEPIHRVLFNCNPADVINKIIKECNANANSGKGQPVKYVFEGESGIIYISEPTVSGALAKLQGCLDKYINENGCGIDYIHGDDVVRKLTLKKERLGLMLPSIEKKELFTAVANRGVLPRKTFSMGTANEKRYYLECRRLF